MTLLSSRIICKVTKWAPLALAQAFLTALPGCAKDRASNKAAHSVTLGCVQSAQASDFPRNVSEFNRFFAQSAQKRDWGSLRMNVGFTDKYVLLRICLQSGQSPTGPMEVFSDYSFLTDLWYAWEPDPESPIAQGMPFRKLDYVADTIVGFVPFPIFPFSMAPNQSQSLLIVGRTETDARFTGGVAPPIERQQHQTARSIVYVFSAGLMLAVSCFWFFSWLSARRKEFLFCALFLFSFHCLMPLLASGIALTVWPAETLHRVTVIMLILAASFQALFVHTFLSTGGNGNDALFSLDAAAASDVPLRAIDFSLSLLALAGVGASLSLALGMRVDSFGPLIPLANAFLLLSTVLALLKTLRARRFGFIQALPMAAGYLVFLLGIGIFVAFLHGFRNLPSNTRYLLVVTPVIEAFLVSYCLQSRFKQLQTAHLLLREEETLNQRFRTLLRLLAHDMATSSTNLGLSIERALKESAQLSAQAPKLTDTIRRSLTAAQSQRSLLHAVMRMENPDACLAEVPDAEVVRAVRALMDACADKAALRGVTLALQASPGNSARRLSTDIELLGQSVVANLLNNALKFSPAGGRIDVRVCVDDAGLAIEIADEGPGIPEATITATDAGRPVVPQRSPGGESGHGLGLVVCFETVRMFGGTLTLERRSDVPTGTRARVVFPWSTVQARPAADEPSRTLEGSPWSASRSQA